MRRASCCATSAQEARRATCDRCARIHPGDIVRRSPSATDATDATDAPAARRFAAMPCIPDRLRCNDLDGQRAESASRHEVSHASRRIRRDRSSILRNRSLVRSLTTPGASRIRRALNGGPLVAKSGRARRDLPGHIGPRARMRRRAPLHRSRTPSRPPMRRPPGNKFSQLRRPARLACAARRAARRQTNESGASRHVRNPRADCSPGCGYASPNDEVNDETQQ